jgi:hypothetical protein
MMRLTKRVVDALSPRQKQYVEYDTDLTGFGVAVYPSGMRSIPRVSSHGSVSIGRTAADAVSQRSESRLARSLS